MAADHVITPRWEWRAFGDRFPEAEAQVMAVPNSVKSSAETYLLCRTPGVNAKIRGNELDVKRLHKVEGGLELWSPVLKASFPITGESVAALFGEWGLTPPAVARPAYAYEEFLTDVIADAPGIHPVAITKERRQAVIDGCSVEVSTVTVGGQQVQTVAVESESPERIGPVVRRLGLSGVGNENYVVALMRLSGFAAH